jgi:hypothetical protein
MGEPGARIAALSPDAREEFYEFVHAVNEGVADTFTGYRTPEWDPPAKGDVLPNGMRGRFHAVIDRSDQIRLGIGRH